MKRFPFPIPSISCIATVLLILVSARPANAEQFGDFGYQVNGDETVTITDYRRDAVGHVEIPAQIDGKTVTSIAYQAFDYCTGLTSVSIPGSVTSIGGWTFSGCTALSRVTIAQGVSHIGSGAFMDCSALTRIAIPKGVTSIGDATFSGCTALTSISIPSSVTQIGEDSSVIGSNSFSGCKNLVSIDVAPGNLHYSSQDGVLLNADKTVLVRCPPGKSGSYAIPENITHIASGRVSHFGGDEGAFVDCHRLTHILIPSSVHNLYSPKLFSGCSSLVSFQVDPGNQAFSSRDGVLFNADMTTLIRCPEAMEGSYHIPNGVESIALPAFSWSPYGIFVPHGSGAFENCRLLTEIRIPASFTGVDPDEDEFNQSEGTYVFAGCRSLKSIEVDPNNHAFSSQDGVLFNSDQTALIRCPEGKEGLYSVPEGVKRITGSDLNTWVPYAYPGAFTDCTQLTEIIIPSSVTELGPRAFRECTGLDAVVFLGDAPTIQHYDIFGQDEDQPLERSSDASIYYLSNSDGFTSPTWKGYPAIEIDVDKYPAASWLLEHGVPHGTDLHQDLNDDGVGLLMAYALDLDPRQNLRGRLPTPVVAGDHLTISFYGATSGITYTVQTSTDLQHWTTEGVTTSELDAVGIRRATVPRDTPQRFLRLLVE